MSTVSVPHLEACLDLAKSDDGLGKRVKEALDVIYDVLETYGEDRVSLSFNGGKDCTVLLHLYAAALFRWRQQRQQSNAIPVAATSSEAVSHTASSRPIPSIYIAPLSPFDELEAFIAASEERYTLSLFRVTPPPPSGVEKGGDGMKYALKAYKNEFPNIEAILVGTRRGDPHGGRLAYKNPTDDDWPQFMRVHPVINWSYADIWNFLRQLSVPYCDLYDAGYTSLGSTFNTHPNPALLRVRGVHSTDQEETLSYLPAYELQDEALERAGRNKFLSNSGLPSPAVELLNPATATPQA
ncbi:hypothetical protein JB92DRAFT_3140888 [Gautieria morchelliformis]|nr:hypothetical protein JB92DRAFT_3140888 [Gautieria morchelliformis]